MKPRVFVGSTSEGKEYAECIVRKLRRIAIPHAWHEGVFEVSGNIQNSLIQEIRETDFVVIVLTGDDMTTSKNTDYMSPRDNLIFEAGMGFGVVDPERTFLIPEKDTYLKIPSDLQGFTLCRYLDTSEDPDDAVAEAVDQIKERIKQLGCKIAVKQKIGKAKLKKSAIELLTSADKHIMLFGRDLSWADTYQDAIKERIENGVIVEVFSEKPISKIAIKNSALLKDIGVKLHQFEHDVGVKFTMIDYEDSHVARFMLAYKERRSIGATEAYYYHCEIHDAQYSRAMWLTLKRLYTMHIEASKTSI